MQVMQNSEPETQSWMKLFFLLLFIAALGFLTIIGGGDDIKMNLENSNTILILKLLQGISALMIFVLPSLLFAMYWTKAKIPYLGITNRPFARTLFIASTGMLLSLPLINWLAEINEKMHLPYILSDLERWMQESEARAEVLTKAFTAGSSIDVLVINVIVIALLAAISEELFFRGVLQKVLMECFKNKHLAIWFSAFVFSAFHMQFYGFLPRMLMGAYLGYLFLWSGSLWVSIMAHFVNNGMAVLLIWLANRGKISVDADKVGIQDNEWIVVLTSILMVAASLLLIYRTEVKRKALQ